jgi:cellulose synthase/poly-beta-1,6-N-acetylglucosamine synthase-like glycosyltransferase
MIKSPIEVSVIVPCYCEERNIGACLESLVSQDYEGRYEIVAVDNDSRDRTQEIILGLAEKHPQIRLAVEVKRGTSAGRERGVREAKYDHIAFIDADCMAPSNWLSVLAEHYQGLGSEIADLAGVGGKNLAPADASGFIKAIEIALDSYIGSFNSVQGRQFSRAAQCSSLSMTNALYKKKWIVETGGFDKSLKSEAEDAEINHRIASRGGRFVFIPESFVWHRMRSSPLGWFRNMFRYGKGRARLLKRYPGMWTPSFILPLIFVSAMLSVSLSVLSSYFLLPVLYFPFLAGFSFYQALRKRTPRLAGHVMLVYVFQHFGYALGEVFGLLSPRVR